MINRSKSQAFQDNKKESQERRASNRVQSTAILQQKGVPFESKNNGTHLIVGIKPELFDFWPGTGKWKCRRTGKEGRGVFSLLNELKQSPAIA
ncbi:hypothetical protein [Marinospirillum perlucidum]|uniref:hypothetical protein n=1 Tax=Marinospirillum perlucidum TaxID=1982602 RepID=UPI000DF2424B|nr:hypothetical protein [Marinospirillum perlucidum]